MQPLFLFKYHKSMDEESKKAIIAKVKESYPDCNFILISRDTKKEVKIKKL